MRNKIITTYTNSKMNIMRKIMGLCTGACLLGHCSKGSLGLFRTLVRVLIQVSKIKRNTLRSGSIRGHQFVIIVEQIYRFYMHAEMILLQHDINIFLSFSIKLQSDIACVCCGGLQLTLFSGQSFIEQLLNSLYFIKELCGLVFIFIIKTQHAFTIS